MTVVDAARRSLKGMSKSLVFVRHGKLTTLQYASVHRCAVDARYRTSEDHRLVANSYQLDPLSYFYRTHGVGACVPRRGMRSVNEAGPAFSINARFILLSARAQRPPSGVLGRDEPRYVY